MTKEANEKPRKSRQLRQKRGRRFAAPVAPRRLPQALFCCLLAQVARAFSPGENALLRCVLVILLAAGLSGCVSSGGGEDWRLHYVTFGSTPPQGNRVTVCHAYTCKIQTPYTFSRQDLAEIAAIMKKVERADTPYEERRAVAYAIAHIEVEVGNKLNIHDKAGMQFSASGDPTQQDCVDESTNTTSYLLVLQSNGLLKHHTVGGTMSKENLAKGLVTLNPVKYWPHFTAVLIENKTGQKYAVDSWLFDQGENPAVVKVEDWYIKDRE
jgi:hypothetical protein